MIKNILDQIAPCYEDDSPESCKILFDLVFAAANICWNGSDVSLAQAFSRAIEAMAREFGKIGMEFSTHEDISICVATAQWRRMNGDIAGCSTELMRARSRLETVTGPNATDPDLVLLLVDLEIICSDLVMSENHTLGCHHIEQALVALQQVGALAPHHPRLPERRAAARERLAAARHTNGDLVGAIKLWGTALEDIERDIAQLVPGDLNRGAELEEIRVRLRIAEVSVQLREWRTVEEEFNKVMDLVQSRRELLIGLGSLIEVGKQLVGLTLEIAKGDEVDLIDRALDRTVQMLTEPDRCADDDMRTAAVLLLERSAIRHQFQGRLERGLRCVEEALVIVLADRKLVAMPIYGRLLLLAAFLHVDNGNVDAALKAGRELRHFAKLISEPQAGLMFSFHADMVVGKSHTVRCEYEDAVRVFRRALSMAENADIQEMDVAVCWSSYAMSLVDAGYLDEADSAVKTSLEKLKKLDDTDIRVAVAVTECYRVFGQIAVEDLEFTEANRHFITADSCLRKAMTINIHSTALVTNWLSLLWHRVRLAYSRGDLGECRDLSTEGITRCRELAERMSPKTQIEHYMAIFQTMLTSTIEVESRPDRDPQPSDSS